MRNRFRLIQRTTGMSFFVRHATLSDMYLCNDTAGNLSSWYWGPKEYATMYSGDVARQLMHSWENWSAVIGVDSRDALIEVDETPVTLVLLSVTH